MKIRPVGAELYHADRRLAGRPDGRTDRHDEANVPFRIFANAPNKTTASVHALYSVFDQNCNSLCGTIGL